MRSFGARVAYLIGVVRTILSIGLAGVAGTLKYMGAGMAENTGTTVIDDVLKERGVRYGAFRGHAEITQSLKWVMRKTEGWARLNDSQKEALDMVAHKIGRILNGDPNYADSWVDIAGYSKLVSDQLEGNFR